MAKTSDTQPELPQVGPKKPASKFPIPWGLLIVLVIYSGCVLLYINATYWSTPEYQAHEHVEAALVILGRTEGEGQPKEKLEEAFVHLLEAARLTPRERYIHNTIQGLREAMEVRHMPPSRELVMRAEAVALVLERIENQEAPTMVTGLRERGWLPRQVINTPRTVVLWALPGGIILILIWGYGQYNVKRVHTDDKEAVLKGLESELADLERARTIGSVHDDGSARMEQKDMLMQGREPKPRPSKAGTAPGTKPRPKKS